MAFLSDTKLLCKEIVFSNVLKIKKKYNIPQLFFRVAALNYRRSKLERGVQVTSHIKFFGKFGIDLDSYCTLP